MKACVPAGRKKGSFFPHTLEFGIERDVALIVAKQVELNLVIAGPGEEFRIERPSIRGEPFPIRCAVRVLPLRGLWH